MVAQKIGQSMMSSQQIEHEDTNTLAVTNNNASRNKTVTKNPALNNPLSKFNKSSR
jgi:hypothetical protein